MAVRPSYAELEQKIQDLKQVELELRKTKQSLKETEDQLNAFFYNSPVGLCILDRDFRYVFINDVLQRINGPSREDHIGKMISEVLPKAAPIIIPIFKKILSTCQPALNMDLSGEVPSSPGKISHYLVSYFPISISSGSPQFIGGVIADITDRKQAEKELIVSKMRYKTLFQDMPAPLWEEDFSEVYAFIDSLKQSGVKDFRAHFDKNPDDIIKCAKKVKIMDVNQATIDLHHAKDKADLLGNLDNLFTNKSLEGFKEKRH